MVRHNEMIGRCKFKRTMI